MKRWTKTLIVLLGSGSLHADDLLIPSVTIDQYTEVAIKKGVQGQENRLSLESAGYSRQISFRQTDSPQLSADHTHTRSETKINRTVTSHGETRESSVSLDEPTPLGTDIQLKETYGDGNKPAFSGSVSQPLYIFTKNASLRTRRRADLNFADAKDTFESTVLSLRTQARSLYYNVMLGEETIKVAERKVSSSKKLLEITQALVQAGKKAPVETMRAKISSQSDERQLENATVSRDKAILSAKNFILYSIEQPLHFTSQLNYKPFAPSVNRLVEFALLHRPQLNSLRRAQELAKLDIDATRETTLPTFTLNSSYGSTEIPNSITRSWSLGGTTSWLFFDSFVTSDKVRSARIAKYVADLNLENAERSLRVDVRNTYMDIKNAEKQIIQFESSRDQSKRNVEVLRLRFQNGLERLIDVFDAENEMRDLDNEYLGLLVSYNRSKDNLTELLGADVETIQ